MRYERDLPIALIRPCMTIITTAFAARTAATSSLQTPVRYRVSEAPVGT